MAKKSETAGKRYPLNMRTTLETRQRLERAARASGRSLVQEVEYRLDKSFSDEDWQKRIFGGLKARPATERMVAAFLSEGQMAARLSGLISDEPADKAVDKKIDWIDNRECYLAAMFGAFHANMLAVPNVTAEDIHLWCEAVKGRAQTFLTNVKGTKR